MRQREEEDDEFSEPEGRSRTLVEDSKKMRDINLATCKVTKLITPEMRKRIDELKRQLDEYATCVRDTLHEIRELDGLSTALELACSLQSADSLETPEARRKREKEKEDEDEELLALLDSL